MNRSYIEEIVPENSFKKFSKKNKFIKNKNKISDCYNFSDSDGEKSTSDEEECFHKKTNCCETEIIIENENNKKCLGCNKNYIWPFYWPLSGSGTNNPSLDIQNIYIGFNNEPVIKWTTNLPTPKSNLTKKNLFSFVVSTGCPKDYNFNFKIRFENSAPNKTVIEVSPHSEKFPLLLNQYLIITDPNISVIQPGTSPTNVQSTISYFMNKSSFYNPIDESVELSNSVRNLVFANQKLFIHINEIDIPVKIVVGNSDIGENLANVQLTISVPNSNINQTSIKEKVTSDINPSTGVEIKRTTIYIKGIYLMSYVVYEGSIINATDFGKVPTTADSRQVPLQLESMILYKEPKIPVINLLNTTENGNEFKSNMQVLYRSILLNNL